MILFVLRESSGDCGTAFPTFREAADAAAAMKYAEIVKVHLSEKGKGQFCALFNRQLGEDARIVAAVHDGKVMMLNQQLAPQQVYACPQGHVRSIIAPVGSALCCGVCGQPLTSG